jgi:hypothetical protein
MRKSSSRTFKLSPENKQVLIEAAITDESPGTILRDFDGFLGYLGESERPITPTHQLAIRMLPDLNARLTRPINPGLRRPQQKSYPYINGLYLLVRASGLTSVKGTGKKPVLSLDQAVYQLWRSLNSTERYCTLLETWLLRGNPETIGESSSFVSSIYGGLLYFMNFFRDIPEEGLRIEGNKDVEYRLSYLPCWYNLALLDLFGILTIKHGQPVEGKAWNIERIWRTPFGNALLALLVTELFSDFERLLAVDTKGEQPFGALQPLLQPYFTDWRNNLSVPQSVFQEGPHIFKVSLGRFSCHIAIPADRSLDELASIILSAVKFDHDHLYQFSYKNRFGGPISVNHPYMDEGPWTSEVLVGDVPLLVGQAMTFLFDFGDQWEFDVLLENVDPNVRVRKPKILEKHGEPPEQYPKWED